MRHTWIIVPFLVLANTVCAASDDWLATFAKRNDGRFSSELTELPKRVTVRTKPFSGWWKFAEFDQERNVLSKDYADNVWSAWLYERCKSSGTYKGSNSFGAKVTVQRLDCERLEIQDHDLKGLGLHDLEIPMTPKQFREFKANGPIYEIEFEVGKGVKQEIALVSTVVDGATVAKPTDRHIRVLRVYGQFDVLRVLASDGKTVLWEVNR